MRVGDNDLSVGGRFDNDAADPDILNRPGRAGDLNDIPRTDRPVKHQDKAADKVADNLLQAKAQTNR